ncbi:amylo-alpha-1,6-glucosidase domain protein [Mycobacterium xenopi 4042]|uniref:Amylo-alpha-1,6-glucosidase domain protein n=1 Tax=Mycobacterium xenopi 4042 TaxID=1299334 RepID=X8AH37_MYCXE|nr:amylo-alpha-1,6-glucosidase domain protein [Mycobacterium xenopi 4042]
MANRSASATAPGYADTAATLRPRSRCHAATPSRCGSSSGCRRPSLWPTCAARTRCPSRDPTAVR